MECALITGATGGIGRSLVKALTERGMAVHALGRKVEALETLARQTGCIAHPVDLTKMDKVRELAERIPADVLINCAGLGAAPGPLHETRPAAIDAVIDVNLRAPLQLIASIVPGMLSRGRGHIVNIGSVAGLYPIPNAAIYGASKSGIHALSSLLRLDLHGGPVRVTEICPGRVETGFFATMTGGKDSSRETYFDGRNSLQPDDIAAAVLFALDAPPHVNVSMIEISPQRQVFGGIDFPPEKPS